MTRPVHRGRTAFPLLAPDVLQHAADAMVAVLPDRVTVGQAVATRDVDPPYGTTVTVVGTVGVPALIEPDADAYPTVAGDPSEVQHYQIWVPAGTDTTHMVTDATVEITGCPRLPVNVGLRLTVDNVHAGSSTEPLLRLTCRRTDQGDG